MDVFANNKTSQSPWISDSTANGNQVQIQLPIKTEKLKLNHSPPLAYKITTINKNTPSLKLEKYLKQIIELRDKHLPSISKGDNGKIVTHLSPELKRKGFLTRTPFRVGQGNYDIEDLKGLLNTHQSIKIIVGLDNNDNVISYRLAAAPLKYMKQMGSKLPMVKELVDFIESKIKEGTLPKGSLFKKNRIHIGSEACVHEDYASKGIATQMLKKQISLIKRRGFFDPFGADILVTGHDKENTKSERFMNRNGYKHMGEYTPSHQDRAFTNRFLVVKDFLKNAKMKS